MANFPTQNSCYYKLIIKSASKGFMLLNEVTDANSAFFLCIPMKMHLFGFTFILFLIKLSEGNRGNTELLSQGSNDNTDMFAFIWV